MSELVIWSAASGEWVSRPADEITWLDRSLLSGGEDLTLHRSPRCPGLRHVHHRWELFSRDPTHQVYVAPLTVGPAPGHTAVRAAAQHVLPVARAAFEPRPVRFDTGAWFIGVGTWVLPVCVNAAEQTRDQPTVPSSAGPTTRNLIQPNGPAGRQAPPATDAVPKVAGYFQRNPTARLAMAYYYRDFLRGGVAPQPAAIADVAVALDLHSEAAVSEYKKELQRRIWNGQGHQRELGEFLLANGLLTLADLEHAMRVAAGNEASGRTGLARQRLRYGSRRRPVPRVTQDAR